MNDSLFTLHVWSLTPHHSLFTFHSSFPERYIGFTFTRSFFTLRFLDAVMNSSEDEMLAALLLLNNRRKRKRRQPRSVWCRDHFLMRNLNGEFHRTYMKLVDNRDEELFFNYMRMSYASFNELKRLLLPRIEPTGCNWREPISGEEKLVLTLRVV